MGERKEKKRRVEEPSVLVELETEMTLDPEVLRIFEETMGQKGVTRASASWKKVFDELVLDRLKEKCLGSWMRQMRLRGVTEFPG